MACIRDGGVFDLRGAPPLDLTAALWSAVAGHDAVPSIRDFPFRAVSNIVIRTVNVGHIRSLHIYMYVHT